MKTVDNRMIDLYRKILSTSAIKAKLPEEAGKGYVTRIKTDQGISFSSWNMQYAKNTFVQGNSGKNVRIMFCRGAGVEWKIDSRINKMNQGEANFYICREENESIYYEENDEYFFDSLCIPYEKVIGMLDAYVSDPSHLLEEMQNRMFSISPEMIRCLSELRKSENISYGLGLMKFNAIVQELISSCLMTDIYDMRTKTGIHKDDLDIIRQLKEQIDRDPAGVPVIQALAYQYAMSISKLTRIFRQEYGISLHSYVIERRLCEGLGLLATGEITVGEVAQRVGYAKQSQFSAAFKKRFGISPSEYY